MTSLALVVLALLLTGCLTGQAELVKALANDPASVCVSVMTPYGSIKVARSANVTGTVKCDGDGMTVSPGGVSIPVNVQTLPMTIVPTVKP